MDLNSKNGTFINGQQIGPGDECELKEGHPITLGDVVVSLGRASSDDESATAESMPIDASGEVSEKDLGRTGPPDVWREASEQAESFLQDRPQTALRNMELIYKASSALMESLHADHNINEILKAILNYILELLKRIDRGVFILLDDETGEISGLIPILKKSRGDTIRVYSRTIVDRVIREGKPVMMLDTGREDEAHLSESMQLMKIKSVMCVPLISRSKIRGVIYVDSVTKPHGFRKEDLSLLTALSIPAAYAIENALLYARLKGR